MISHALVAGLFSMLQARGYTISVAESCTGGGLGVALTSVAGSSKYFKGGVIAYSYAVKQDVLHIPAGLLAQFGAVSRETALEMGQRIRELLHAEVGIAITGIAGPEGGTSEKPVGLVYISVVIPEDTVVEECHFAGGRQEIRAQSVDRAIVMAINILGTD